MLNYRRSLMMAQTTDIEILGDSWQLSEPSINNPQEIYSVENLEIIFNDKTIRLDNITLRGVSTFRDKIYTNQGKVWLEQNIGVYTLAKGIGYHSNGMREEYDQMYTDNTIFIDGMQGHPAATTMGLSTHLPYNKRAYTDPRGEYLCATGTRIWFSTSAYNIYSFKKWINEDNTIDIIYNLQTPIVTEITGELADKILQLSYDIVDVSAITLSDTHAKIKII